MSGHVLPLGTYGVANSLGFSFGRDRSWRGLPKERHDGIIVIQSCVFALVTHLCVNPLLSSSSLYIIAE